MEERTIKRLLITVAVAIVIILVAKFMLTKAITNLGNAATEKKRAAAVQQASPPANEAPKVIDLPDASATSSVAESAEASSPVEASSR